MWRDFSILPSIETGVIWLIQLFCLTLAYSKLFSLISPSRHHSHSFRHARQSFMRTQRTRPPRKQQHKTARYKAETEYTILVAPNINCILDSVLSRRSRFFCATLTFDRVCLFAVFLLLLFCIIHSISFVLRASHIVLVSVASVQKKNANSQANNAFCTHTKKLTTEMSHL